MITIRTATLDERAALEELQRRSSTHQPMYREQLEANPDAIELPAEQIEGGDVRVAERDGNVVGFLALLGRAGDACELDGLFVEPEAMRGGVGRRLVEEAVRMARERGAARIEVVANPQALEFYGAVGFEKTGEEPTRFGPAPRMALAVTGHQTVSISAP
jgi:N-acetylglutamate synthase-like GNAT family acetyltransferase